MPADDLYDAANSLLGASMMLLSWTGRAFVSNGAPSYDCCPQLTVHAGPFNRDLVIPTPGSPSPRQAAARRTTRGSKNIIPLFITVLECVATVKEDSKSRIIFPDPETLDSDSKLMMGDCWTLWNGLVRMVRSGELFSSVEGCRCVDFGPAQPVPDQGGCGGWMINVGVQLDGSDVTS